MSYPAGASLQLAPNSKFIIQNSKYTLWQTFRVCQSFLYATYTLHLRQPAACAQFKIHNSKFKIHHNSPSSHCKIFAKVGKIPPPPIVKIMLNFTMYNVKFFIFSHQPNPSANNSEGLAKDERRIIPPHILRYTLWQTFRVCQSFLYPQFKIHNSKFIIHNSPNSHCKIFAKVGKIPPHC